MTTLQSLVCPTLNDIESIQKNGPVSVDDPPSVPSEPVVLVDVGSDVDPGAGKAIAEAADPLEQQVKKPFGSSGDRSLEVTAVDAPLHLGFAGTMGPSSLRWGFDLAPVGKIRTDVVLWIETDRHGPMRLMPAGVLKSMFRRVNERELKAIKSAVESASPPIP